MNLFLSKTEALKIFTKFDNQGNGQIDYDEFEGCFKLLQLEIVLLVLEDMGITREALAFGFTRASSRCCCSSVHPRRHRRLHRGVVVLVGHQLAPPRALGHVASARARAR